VFVLMGRLLDVVVAAVRIGQRGVLHGIQPGGEPVDRVAGARQPGELAGEVDDSFPELDDARPAGCGRFRYFCPAGSGLGPESGWAAG
jgi:hypothetical protein